jgi:two-component system sensor histidine kinase HydH
MERRLLILMTAPTVVIGLLLFAACLVSAWSVNHVQARLSDILASNVSSMESAQELEINLRKLRFHCYLYLIEPKQGDANADLLAKLAADDRDFRLALEEAERWALTPQEVEYVGQIRSAYQHYQDQFQELSRRPPPPQSDYKELATLNPIRPIVEPCERYFHFNKEQMNRMRQENEHVSRLLRWVLLLLGLVGPISGLLIGWSMARGLSRSVQRELLHAQQLSALGQLAASLAHEVRNPLMSIKMLVEAALRSHNPRPFTHDNLHVVHRAVARLEKTVQGFLDFARPPALQRSVCDLRVVAAEAVELVRARAGQQKVDLVLSCPEQPIYGDVDRTRLCAVFVNLCLNSLDAMPGGGRLEIHLCSEPDRILVRVLDTGTGIAPEVAGRLFTPFASSKPTGTGLGLCISKRIIEDHGGRIAGCDRPEGGACFTIVLPQTSPADRGQ